MNQLFPGNSPVRQAIFPPAGGGFEGVTEVTGNYLVLTSDLEKVLHVTADAVVTFGDLSPAFVYIEADGATVTLAASGTKTLGGAPLVFLDGTSVIVYLDGTVHRVMGSGEVNTVSNAGDDSDGLALAKAKVGYDTPIKRIRAAVGSGRFFEYANAIEYVAEGQYMDGVQAYFDATSMAGDIRAIDDLVAGMKGLADSVSLRGTSWDQMSEDIYSKLLFAHVYLSDYNFGSGTTVQAIKGSNHGTILGGMAWAAGGFVFDGVNDAIQLPAAILTTAVEWTMITVLINSAAGGVAEIVIGQNAGGAGRGSFGNFETDGSYRIFHNDGTTSVNPTTGVSETDADARMFMSRWTTANGLQVFKDTALTAPGAQTTAVAPKAYQNTTAYVGCNNNSSAWFSGTMKFNFFFLGSVDPADKNKLRILLQNVFSITIQA